MLRHSIGLHTMKTLCSEPSALRNFEGGLNAKPYAKDSGAASAAHPPRSNLRFIHTHKCRPSCIHCNDVPRCMYLRTTLPRQVIRCRKQRYGPNRPVTNEGSSRFVATSAHQQKIYMETTLNRGNSSASLHMECRYQSRYDLRFF